MTPQFKGRDTTPLFNFVARRAKKNGHFRKLRGTEAKPAVIIGATTRLLAPGKLVKLPSKPGKPDRWRLKPVELVELLPKPLQTKMRQLPPPIGNIQLHQSPLHAPRWRALEAVYRQLFELSPIWEVTGAARVELIDNAIDAERKEYIKATEVAGGRNGRLKSDRKLYDLERYTDAGDSLSREPSREHEKETKLQVEACELIRRERIEADENAKLREAVETYARELKCRDRQQRQRQQKAINLICFEPTLKGHEIATRCRISEGAVSKLRADIEELADKILSIAPEEGSAVESSAAGVAHDETATQIAESAGVEKYEIDATADLSKSTVHSDALDLMATFQAPEIDDDVSEATMRNYARSKSNDAHMRDSWSGARRRDTNEALATGNKRYGGRFANPAEIALREERKFMRDYSAPEMKMMEEAAAKFGVNLQGLLKSAAVHRANRLQEAEKAHVAASQLRRAAWLLEKSAEELRDIKAWAAPLCKSAGTSFEALFGTDAMLSSVIVPKT